jgi:hypothetical protein
MKLVKERFDKLVSIGYHLPLKVFDYELWAKTVDTLRRENNSLYFKWPVLLSLAEDLKRLKL